jgi:hypothetical protein
MMGFVEREGGERLKGEKAEARISIVDCSWNIPVTFSTPFFLFFLPFPGEGKRNQTRNSTAVAMHGRTHA